MNDEPIVEAFVACGECQHWWTRPDNAYNKIHNSVKQCRQGSFIHLKTRSCHLFTKKNEGLRRRKITTA